PAGEQQHGEELQQLLPAADRGERVFEVKQLDAGRRLERDAGKEPLRRDDGAQARLPDGGEHRIDAGGVVRLTFVLPRKPSAKLASAAPRPVGSQTPTFGSAPTRGRSQS